MRNNLASYQCLLLIHFLAFIARNVNIFFFVKDRHWSSVDVKHFVDVLLTINLPINIVLLSPITINRINMFPTCSWNIGHFIDVFNSGNSTSTLENRWNFSNISVEDRTNEYLQQHKDKCHAGFWETIIQNCFPKANNNEFANCFCSWKHVTYSQESK